MEFFLIAALVFCTLLYAGLQYMKRNRLHRHVHETVVRQLLELVQCGDITAFGYYPERYSNENKWAPLIFFSGANWEFCFHSSWEHKNHGRVPGEVMVFLFWIDELDVKTVLDDLATRVAKLDRTFKVFRSVDLRTKHKTLKVRKLQALAA